MTYRFFGIRADGTEVLLPLPAGARFDSAEDVPADSFQGIFPLTRTFGTLVRLRIDNPGGDPVFIGTVDVQREIVSGSGKMMRLSCRNLAGFLLDSAPVPVTLCFPSLGTIFERHVKPYGFTSFLGSGAVFREPFRIEKGMSEWSAATGFCKKFLHVTPRVRGTVFDASGSLPGGNLVLDNAGGTCYFSAEVRTRCCDRLTEVYEPDAATGAYRLTAEDKKTAAMGILRKRCLTGTGEDAEALLARADRSAFAVYASCPGAPKVSVGASSSLNDPVLGYFDGLTVAQLRCEYDAGGLRTSYCLRRN
jgi:hypothetical protein